MKRLLLILAITLLFSCSFGYIPSLFPSEDQFEVETVLDKKSETGVYRFLVLTDGHFGRNDSGVHHFITSFNDFYSSYGKEIDATFLLGDMMDKTDENCHDLFVDFVKTSLKSKDSVPVIYVLGNHEIEHNDPDYWYDIFSEDEKALFSSFGRMGRYRVGDVAIYKLDSAFRTFGPYQLRQLENHLAEDKAKYRLFLSHVPLASSAFDQSLVQFTFSSAEERNRMLRLMSEHGPSWYFAGHHHIGNISAVFSSSVKEFIFSSFHRRDVFYESKGYWYIVELTEDGKLTIIPYYAETGEELEHIEL